MGFNPRTPIWLLLLALPAFARAEGQVELRIREAQAQERLLDRVNARIALEDFRGGLEILDEADVDAQHPRLLNARGVCLAGLDRHGEAVKVFERALLLDITRAEFHRNLAISLGALGVTGRALSEFAEAVRLDPRDAETRLALGTALSAYRRYEGAWEELRVAERLRPEDARVQRALAIVAEARSDSSAARTHWSRVDELLPTAESARALARLATEGNTELGFYLACVERDSLAMDCRAAAASIYLRHGELGAALRQLRVAVEGGADAEAAHNLFLGLQMAGRSEELESWLQREEPPFPATWGAVALARRDAGRTDQALAAVRRGRELDPEDLDLANLEAVLLEESGDSEAAAALWRWILVRDPGHGQARENLRGRQR